MKRKILKLLVHLRTAIEMPPADDRLCCPNCGKADSWSIRNYSELNCNTCYHKYVNLGKLGLQPLNK